MLGKSGRIIIEALLDERGVVTRSIPPGVIAAGNPARVIRDVTEADRTGYRPIH